MKRNKIFVLGLIAAFVAILSLTLVSGTWAKYTSTVTGSSTARVAKWSFDGADLSAKTITFNLFETVSDTNVKTGTNENIIAPGTKGTAGLTLKNTGEVNAKATVTLEITSLNAELLEALTFKNGTEVLTLTTSGGKKTVTLDAVTLAMGDATGTTLNINWEWPFERTDKDATDTAMGVEGTATITVKAIVVFEQVD